MVPHLSEREDSIEHINAMCLHLFHLWCETRSVVPLTYLLRAWPLMNSDPETLRRLGTALRDLRRQHLHDFNDGSFQEVCRAIGLCRGTACSVVPVNVGDERLVARTEIPGPAQ
ncbi:hypothetical protein LMG27177_07286 [Paraburkholderia fynbosensis]|uniref:Uncharacterized protein n=1 Tax=Paraburkholderia fynbosensis TaxID=1200993 RepID=A0A6J5H4M3_9BURK|nr:hypothetical protein LMG27177_07286 [Paraburkholderia fynbosensis]